MFPIKDNVPSRHFPVMTVLLIVANTLIFLGEVAMGHEGLKSFVYQYGLVPVHVTSFLEHRVVSVRLAFVPFFSSMLLHGGWFHLIGNMWYLWIFGDNVEDRLGRFRFLLFYVLCGLIGNVGHYTFNRFSVVPAIGASGAVAGVLGAYAVSYPRARIVVLLPLFYFIQFVELPALLVLGFWFVLQFINGAASLVISTETGGVAWWAHIGGFLGGILIFLLFRPKPRVAHRTQ